MTLQTRNGDLASRRYNIEGFDLGYPTLFHDGSQASAMYAVNSAVANELIAESGFEVAEIFPGKAVLVLTGVHYTDTECGVYEEMAFAFLIKRPGAGFKLPYLSTLSDLVRGKVGSFTWRLPVTSAAAEQCGIQMWGYPKTIEDIRYSKQHGSAEFTLAIDGTEALRFSVKTKGSGTAGPVSPPVYSVFEGRPHVGYLTQHYRHCGYHRSGTELVLAEHPWNEPLKRLGLPRKPLLSIWNGGLSFSMSAPVPV